MNRTAIQAIVREFIRVELELYRVNPYYERDDDDEIYANEARIISQSKMLPNVQLNNNNQAAESSLDNKIQMIEQSDINKRSIRLLAYQMDPRDIFLCCVNVQMPRVDPFELNGEIYLNISKQILYSHERCAKISFESNYFLASDNDVDGDDEGKEVSEKMIDILNRMRSDTTTTTTVTKAATHEAEVEDERLTKRIVDQLVKLKQSRPADYYVPVMAIAVTVIVSVLTGLAILMVFLEFLCSCHRPPTTRLSSIKKKKRHNRHHLDDSTNNQFDAVNEYFYQQQQQEQDGYTIGDYLRRIESTESPVSTITMLQNDHLIEMMSSDENSMNHRPPPAYNDVFHYDGNDDDKSTQVHFHQPSSSSSHYI